MKHLMKKIIKKKYSKIWLAGHRGLVGSAVLKLLKKNKYNVIHKTSLQLDLRNKIHVTKYLKINKPDLIILCAGKVGGILANSLNPIEFYYDNITIGNNVIKSAFDLKIKNLIYLGSSCIYPSNLKRKINESDLLNGKLEKTNEYYALAKISCTKFCQSISKVKSFKYTSIMPCNVYGPNDNFDKTNSHVFAALISKIYNAKINNKKKISLWGSGKPRREFIHSYDLAKSIKLIMEKSPNSSIINVGVGNDISIKRLAYKISKELDFNGKIIFDNNRPDGTYRKLLNNSKIINLGWKQNIDLDSGIKDMIFHYRKNIKKYGA